MPWIFRDDDDGDKTRYAYAEWRPPKKNTPPPPKKAEHPTQLEKKLGQEKELWPQKTGPETTETKMYRDDQGRILLEHIRYVDHVHPVYHTQRIVHRHHYRHYQHTHVDERHEGQHYKQHPHIDDAYGVPAGPVTRRSSPPPTSPPPQRIQAYPGTWSHRVSHRPIARGYPYSV